MVDGLFLTAYDGQTGTVQIDGETSIMRYGFEVVANTDEDGGRGFEIEFKEIPR